MKTTDFTSDTHLEILGRNLENAEEEEEEEETVKPGNACSKAWRLSLVFGSVKRRTETVAVEPEVKVNDGLHVC